MPDTKRCSRCREKKPLTEFRKARHNRSGDGHRSMCKPCMKRSDLPAPQKIKASAAQVRPFLAVGFADRRKAQLDYQNGDLSAKLYEVELVDDGVQSLVK